MDVDGLSAHGSVSAMLRTSRTVRVMFTLRRHHCRRGL